MNKLSTIKIQRKLLYWGEENYRPYTWREVEDPWLALLAELLLQRTSANQVESHFEEIRYTFPTPESVIAASDNKLKMVEDRFGLDRRMRSLRELAEYIDTQYIYPTDYETLTSLYGIGHYTAAAYLSLHMNVRAVLVD